MRANEECPQGQRWVKEGCSGWGLGRGLKGRVENSQHREDETERGAEPQKGGALAREMKSGGRDRSVEGWAGERGKGRGKEGAVC